MKMPKKLPVTTGDATLLETMETIDQGACRIALVLDPDGRLVGTVTDGDILRALLKGAAVEDPVERYMNRAFTAVNDRTSRGEVLDLMQARFVQQIPVLDDTGRPIGLHLLREIVGRDEKPNWAIVMAGGRGERLRPLTDMVLKPMVSVAGRPILERIILHLVGQGIQRIFISINYLGETVERRFGDGRAFGCEIEYLREDFPLGTGGSLSLLPERPEVPVLVLNGDLIVQFDVGALLADHAASGAAATMAVTQHTHQVPYGVLTITGDRVVDMREKPIMTWMINAGVYVLEPHLVERVPHGVSFPLPALLEECLERGETVAAHHIDGEWKDVGCPYELHQARGEAQ